jgi:hypothetical protein
VVGSSSAMLSSAMLLAAPAVAFGTANELDGSAAPVGDGLVSLAPLVLTPKASPNLAVSLLLLLVSASSFADCLRCSLNRRRAAIRSSRDADCILFGLRTSPMKPERRREARLLGGCNPDAAVPSASKGGGRGPSAEARVFSPSCSLAGRRSIRLSRIS